MLTTREFQRGCGPLMPLRRVRGAPGVAGFYQRIYASLASERVSSFRIADNDDDHEEEEEEED
ncbi:Uncharacterized protein DBV15_10542 [Temnothorax longispinosus]|uniref:Uncharacterized protein n=1 Tax=Temnothorax longispinosus TaxID=300112 RepID=A0A4S2L7G0_9HYME|nr:Uncharacterized protein DBV15_10542 [Temnothorax longispinosus]